MQPPWAMPASCGDHEACFEGGRAASRVSHWRFAVGDFQKAASLDPLKPDPWAQVGEVYFATGQYGEAVASWDKALRMGGPVLLPVCRERPFRCEMGFFSLGPEEISFANEKGQELFAVEPSKVGPVRTETHVSVVPPMTAFFRLRVNRKNYNFDYLPAGALCATGFFLQCPGAGPGEQQTVASYVARTIPRIALGQFSGRSN